MLQQKAPAQVKVFRIEDVLASPRVALAGVELMLRGSVSGRGGASAPAASPASPASSVLDAEGTFFFNAGKTAAVESVARGMVVKHSASRAWDAAVGELNRTTIVHRGSGSTAVAFTVPLKASTKLHSKGVDAVAAALFSANGGPELCRLLAYCK